MKGVYVFLADGFEVSEALTTVNMLRRGGVNVKTVSIYDDRIVSVLARIRGKVLSLEVYTSSHYMGYPFPTNKETA